VDHFIEIVRVYITCSGRAEDKGHGLSNGPRYLNPPHGTCVARLSQWGKQFNVARKGSGSKLMRVKLMNLDGDTVEVGVTVELAGVAEVDTYRVQKDVGASWT
jgi:hypothetical protein